MRQEGAHQRSLVYIFKKQVIDWHRSKEPIVEPITITTWIRAAPSCKRLAMRLKAHLLVHLLLTAATPPSLVAFVRTFGWPGAWVALAARRPCSLALDSDCLMQASRA